MPASATLDLTVVLVALFASVVGPVTLAYFNGRQRRTEKVELDARADKLANADRIRAADLILAAQEAAHRIANANQVTNDKVDTAIRIGVDTHKIVNSQRTLMLKVIALQARRIATDNPADTDAAEAATEAEAEYQKSATAAATLAAMSR